MLKRVKSYMKLLKLGGFGQASEQMNHYFRNLVVSGLTSFLDYLLQPREFNEIVDEFQISDREYLHLLLTTLQSDDTVVRNEDGRYHLGGPVKVEILVPTFFTESVDGWAKSMANAVFDRLSGICFDSTSGFNLFYFDDALSMEAYSIIRKSALSFVPEPLSNPGKFLDLGCGSGNSTADIWSLIMKNTKFQPSQDFEMVGVDIDENFVNIANEEFYDILKNYMEISPETYSELEGQLPEFKIGRTTQIPFPDSYFDNIFLSQVLHWTDLKASLKEIHRVLKPGGIFFGTNLMFPRASPYLNIMLNTIEGAGGFFTKEKFIEDGEAAGFSKFDFCTPTTIFRLEKPVLTLETKDIQVTAE